MTTTPNRPAQPLSLGIEGGGTRTTALLANAHGRELARAEAGPGNLKLLSDAALLKLFRSIASRFPRPAALGIGMAGARTPADLARIHLVAARVWPGVPCESGSDVETALAAAGGETTPGSAIGRKIDSRRSNSIEPQHGAEVLILSGTGSCCYGRNCQGTTAKVGGLGHLLGDRGSAYQIGLKALQTVLAAYDRNNAWPELGGKLLRALLQNEPENLVNWVQHASKSEIAALAIEVFAAHQKGDRLAATIIAGAADELAADAIACARRLAKPGQPVRFILGGGTLLKQPAFAKTVRQRVQKLWPAARIERLGRESVWGAVEMARRASLATKLVKKGRTQSPSPNKAQPWPDIPSGALSPTEQRNPRSRDLDRLPMLEAVELMIAEDRRIGRALKSERHAIARGVELIASALKRGGRLIYVGAGTSGRLGVLDASECPPTFRTPPEMIQGVIAGKQSALWRAVEGAEDDADAGAQAIGYRRVSGRDVVVGIAASGRTPFVWGALQEAKARGARTILLTFNPHLKVAARSRPTLMIAPEVGPEILTGSTRLKAGTATKLVLNMFTTLAMVRLGKVMGNLMVDLNPSNAKLRDRAVRIVRALTGADQTAALQALTRSGWIVKAAVARLSR